MMERLQKVLAQAGVGSRRHCEILIAERRIKVNGIVVDQPGQRVDPTTDEIEVDGTAIEPQKHHYYLLHKPKGYLCSSRSQGEIPSVLELVRSPGGERLFCVGRLDQDSQGALIVTNDGEFGNLLTHPRYGVTKTYRVAVRGRADAEALERIRHGVYLAEGKTSPARIHVLKRSRDISVLKVTLREGKNRHLRRVFARIGFPVKEILRVSIGSLHLGRLRAREYRELTAAELKMLRREATPDVAQSAPATAPAPERRRRSARQVRN